MNVLMINHEFPPVGGGGGNANYYIAREVARQGHAVTVLTSGYGALPAEEVRESIRIWRLPSCRRYPTHTTLREQARHLLSAWERLPDYCGRQPADVVHAFFALPNGPLGWRASRLLRVPWLIRLGGGDLPEHDPGRQALHRLLIPACRWFMGKAQGLVVNSEGLRERAEKYYPSLQFRVIPNGVDLSEFHPGPSRSASDPVRLLFVSRLVKRKGLQYLIPALARLKTGGRAFHLTVIGDGPARDELTALVQSHCLEAEVTMLGAVAHADLPAHYREADLFVLPSLNEGMPNVVLEAMASGLPVLLTDVPGADELVEDAVNGFRVPPGDQPALEKGLAQALARPERLAAMGAESVRKAEAFSWRAVGSAYIRLYEEICRASQPGRPPE